MGVPVVVEASPAETRLWPGLRQPSPLSHSYGRATDSSSSPTSHLPASRPLWVGALAELLPGLDCVPITVRELWVLSQLASLRMP